MSSILYTLREISMNQTTVTNRRYQKELGFALLLYTVSYTHLTLPTTPYV